MLLCHVSPAKSAFACLSLIFALSVFALSSNAQVQYELPPQEAPVERILNPGLRGSPTRAGAPLFEGTRSFSEIDLDPAFNPAFDLAYGIVYSVEQQADGKFLVAGVFKSFNGFASSGIVRLNADRSIDTGFSVDIRGFVHAIAIQPDGKIVVVGFFYSVNGVPRNSIARLNANGTLDTAFDTSVGTDTIVRDVSLYPGGKVLIAGDFRTINGSPSLAVARLNADGTVDGSFVSPAVPTPTVPNPFASTIGVQLDGKIVLAGSMGLGRSLVRLQANGSVDNGFAPSMNSNPWKIAIQPDGKIVMGGFFTTVNGVSRPRIARLNESGTLDETFNPGTGANTSVLFVRVAPSGKILVSGTFTTVNGTPRSGIALLNADGSLDTEFAPTGTTVGTVRPTLPLVDGHYFAAGSFSRFSGIDRNTIVLLDASANVDPNFVATSLRSVEIRATAVQADGKILVAGLLSRVNGQTSNSLVRFSVNGTLDPTFSSGTTLTGLVNRLVFQPDGKILVFGSGIQVNGGAPAAMVRLNADGTHDSSFVLGSIPQILQGNAAAVQPDGMIFLAYRNSSANPANDSGLVRLFPNGSVDPSFTSLTLRFESLAVLPNGQIMAAGPFGFGYVSSGSGFEPHHGILRLNSDGSHDRTFRSPFVTDSSAFTAVYSMHVLPDGKILVGGAMFTVTGTLPVGVARLNPAGSLDGAFQTSPITSAFVGNLGVYSLSMAGDEKILAGGLFNSFGGTAHDNLVRLESNGSVDQSFTAGTDDTVFSIATQINGSVVIGGSFTKVNNVPRTGLARLSKTIPGNTAPFDFDGDGKTDIGVIHDAGSKEWWVNRSSAGLFATPFGTPTDVMAPADFTGDGKTDVAVFRPSDGFWYVLKSEDQTFFGFPFGTNGDIPAPGDFDGDGKADATVFRPSIGTWFQLLSGGGSGAVQFGAAGDKPIVADYDGDGKSDVAVYRAAGASGAEWWVLRSTAGLFATVFGNSTDKAVPGDYTGDGKTDVAVWRPSNGFWYVLRSEDILFYGFPWGANGDIPAPGDYDGDGKYDAAVFRSGTWYVNRSTGTPLITAFGSAGDRPIPNAFVP